MIPGSLAKLAIIIPTLNEAANLPACLRSLRGGADFNLEIFVVDGGSKDQTAEIAKASPGCRLILEVIAFILRQIPKFCHW